MTLYGRQQKRHRCIEQSFGLCGRGRGWDDLGEWHWNMYNIIYEMNHQSRFNAWYRMLGAGVLGWPRGMVQGGRWKGGSRIRSTCTPVTDSCWCMAKPIQYCKVISLQLNKFILKKKKESACQCRRCGFSLWVGKIPWRRKWQPTPGFLPGKSHRQRNLAGCSPWGCKRVGCDLVTKQQQQSHCGNRFMM